jgi:hypothetical protein
MGGARSAAGIREGAPPCRLVGWEGRLGWRDFSAPYAPPSPVALYPSDVAAMGGGCAASLASLRRLWAIAASVNSSCAPAVCAAGAGRASGCASMGEQHLDALAIVARLLECVVLGECARDVAGLFVEAARDLPCRLLGTVSISTELGPRIGIQRGPLGVCRPEAMREAFGVAQRIAGGRSEDLIRLGS